MSQPPTTSPLPSDEVRRRPEPPLPEPDYLTRGAPKPRPRSEDGWSPSFPRLKRMVTLLGESSSARVEAYLILLVIAAAVITAHRIL